MSGRRSLLGTLAAFAVVPAAVPVVTAAVLQPDAVLLAMGREAAPLIAEYERLTARYFALPPGHPGVREAGDASAAIYDRLEELTDLAQETRATTLDGFKAKARLLQHGLRSTNRMDGKVRLIDPEQELAWSLVADLLHDELDGEEA